MTIIDHESLELLQKLLMESHRLLLTLKDQGYPPPAVRERARTVLLELQARGWARVGLDLSKAPNEHVERWHPLVLYFATKADADELKSVILAEKPNMVGIHVDRSH